MAIKGCIFSKEHRQKLSEAHKGKTLSQETKNKMSKIHKGHLTSIETRTKISEANKGHSVSFKTKLKISKANKGYHHTDEAKRKIREALKGKYRGGIWCSQNREGYLKQNRDYMKEYYKDNKDKRLEYSKIYNKTENGKDVKRRAKIKRRANGRDIINTLTQQEWLNLLEEYNYRCAYCGVEFEVENMPTRDHVIPISKGGDNTKDNIVPACRSCNCRKFTHVNLKLKFTDNMI